MTDPLDMATVARDALSAWSAICRLRVLSEEHWRAGEALLAVQTRQACAPHHAALSRLAAAMGLPPLTLEADVACFARAQLGLAIDAPWQERPHLVRRSASWRRDLVHATQGSATGSAAAT